MSSITEVQLCQIHTAGVPCLGEAVSFWDAGCVHEHITSLGLCADDEWRATGRQWICILCRDGENPHECFALVRRAAS